MNPAPQHDDWLDQVQTGRVRAELDAALRSQLRGRPRELERLDEELRLNRALAALPQAEVPSNFTARVLAEIEREEAKYTRHASPLWRRLFRLQILRPLAGAAVITLALVGWWQARLQERHQLAASISVVSGAAAVPGMEWLTDFDAIRLLRTPAQPGDLELIAALATP